MNDQSWSVLPKDFIDLLYKVIPEDYQKNVLNSFCQRRPTTFRTNTLKISTLNLKKELDLIKVNYQSVSWYDDAFILISSLNQLLDSNIYKNGLIYVQNLSSMIPPLILDPKPFDKVCDLTAAPGSKTSQIAALMNNTGLIIANDLSKVRLFKLTHNLKLLGVTNTKTSYKPGQLLWKDYPEYFDKTLIDTPCSLEGTFSTLYNKSYIGWSLKKVKQLSNMQKFLLRSAISLTKVGGIIIYSTCTLSPEENEEVVDWILKKEKGVIKLEKINFKIDSPCILGLESWKNRQYDPSLKYTLRILPSQTMEGFFIAVFKKVSSNINLNYL